MNKTFYLVLVTFRGDISFGMDEETYLVGVHLTLDNAKEALEKYSNSIEPFASDFYFKYYFGDTVLCHPHNEIEEDEKERYSPVRYCDGDYSIVKFDGDPAFLTGSSYIE